MERERFQREARAVAALRHPNVVQIFDIGESDGRPYFTMEFLEGGSLSAKLAGAPQPAADAATLVATLARAVHTAHKAGIVHRDLKPANVLLTGDDVAKITDFGLARRLDDDTTLTGAGTPMGTPSYMAPEQIKGNSAAVGPPADIYALGAILYEMLTGRPPFLAETPHDTFQQAVSRDPVPPSRLNSKVPKDLETICLTCLRKDPEDRYATANALADDTDCFLRGEPISARPEGWIRGCWRRIRRRPVQAMVTTAVTLLIVALLGAGAYLLAARATEQVRERATQETVASAAKDDLDEMIRCLKLSAWADARNAMERAKGRLQNVKSSELAQLLKQGEADLEFTARLAKIRTNIAVGSGREATEKYESEFRKAGYGTVGDDPVTVANRVKQSNVEHAIIDGLDDWALCAIYRKSGEQEAWVLDVTRKADPDPSGWRDRLRDPRVRKSKRELVALMDSAKIDSTPVNLLVALATLVNERGGDPIPFLVKVQQRYPDDLWANWLLAHIERNPYDAVRYYQAALAIRPNTPYLLSSMGEILRYSRRPDEAIFYADKAARLDPKNGIFLGVRAGCLADLNRLDEAIEDVKKGLFMPRIEATDRTFAEVMRKYYLKHAVLDKALASWQTELGFDRPEHDDWYGYAELCLYLHREDLYRECRTKMLKKFGSTVDPVIAERTGRACLLLGGSANELKRAVALTERATRTTASEYRAYMPYFHFANGLAEYRQGHFDRAIEILHGDPTRIPLPTPGLVLAMALQQSGKHEEAKVALDKAIGSYDWQESKAQANDDWISHVLRREAEAMIAPKLTGQKKERSGE
jgi:serine/threonine-protein kinase